MLFAADGQIEIPTFVAITTGKVNDVKMLDKMPVQEDEVQNKVKKSEKNYSAGKYKKTNADEFIKTLKDR